MDNSLIFTLFGATGDLAFKKILPALHNLHKQGRLPKDYVIQAFSRRPWKDAEYHAFIKISDPDFLKHVRYVAGNLSDPESFKSLKQNSGRNLFYFAVGLEFYELILNGLEKAGLLKSEDLAVLIEKPFGHDESSAKELEAKLEKRLKPEQILRVDHYLAKELINLKSKGLTNKSVKSITVKFFEKIGIEGRGEFYESVGAIIDVGQNHLLEMLATAIMDTYNTHKSRFEALSQLNDLGELVTGQYEGYKNESDVSPDSKVETYFRSTLASSASDWAGVSIKIEAGKAMADKTSEIVVEKKDGEHIVFKIKDAGRDAYEILIEAAIAGKTDLFANPEEIFAAWHLIDPILKKRAKLEPLEYQPGTNGPQ